MLDAHAYVSALVERGLFGEGTEAPELNAAVWRRYLHHYGRFVGPVSALRVLMTPEGLGLYLDPLNETGCWEWALLGPISHASVPWSAAEIVAGVEALAERFAALGLGAPRVRTDTFGLPAPDPALERHFLWLNSPRARFWGDLDRYLASLNHDRRKGFRALIRRFDAMPELSLQLSEAPPTPDEQTWLCDRSAERWGGDAPYALAQWAWPLAVAEALPGSASFMRADWRGERVLMAAYVRRGESVTCQATCRVPVDALSGLGGFVDGELIRRLCRPPGPVQVVDPTCRTGIEDTPGIWVSKRHLVNEDATWPVLIVDAEAPELPEGPGLVPRYDPGRGWILPPARVLVGRSR